VIVMVGVIDQDTANAMLVHSGERDLLEPIGDPHDSADQAGGGTPLRLGGETGPLLPGICLDIPHRKSAGAMAFISGMPRFVASSLHCEPDGCGNGLKAVTWDVA
jgi:hypothetical protein